MDRNSLYYSSVFSESPSVKDSTSRHANRFTNSFEMSSMSLLPSNLMDQSVYLNPMAINDTIVSNRGLLYDLPEEEPIEDMEDSSLSLYHQFFEMVQKYAVNDDNVFQMVTEFELLCCDHLTVTSNLLKSKVRHSEETQDMNKLVNVLRLERNSWRLFNSMFEDRVKSGHDSEDMNVEDIIVKLSDRQLIDRVFESDSRLRQMQSIVDWLERNESDDNEEMVTDRVQFYSEGPHYWENTFHALRTRTDNYAKERLLCERMDPDAPIRTKRPLHDLDVEDEGRLFRYIYKLLRAGQLPDAKDITQRLGYYWLATALDGWLLHHDPNYTDDKRTIRSLEPTEGNSDRDLWKYVCWRASKTEVTNVYERAIFAALSGNLSVLSSLCTNWSDKLWAYFKCSLDVHIEQQLRETVVVRPEAKARFRVDLPDSYWDNKLTAKDIFREIESHGSVTSAVEDRYHQSIQKFVILDDIDGLIDYVYECTKIMTDLRQSKTKTVPGEVEPQMLRFFAHLVLALRHLKLGAGREHLCVAVVEAYIQFLIDRNDIELVAYYTSKLPKRNQIITFAKLLEGIEDENDRKLCLCLAKKANLDIGSITITVVDNVRIRAEDQSSQLSSELSNATTAEDKRRINSLDWLLFSEVQQFSEALKTSNCLMRDFLLSRKVDAMREVFNKLPEDIIDCLFSQWRRRTGRSELSADDDNAIREYLCHKAYIQANDAFTDWQYCLHNTKPKAPPKPTSTRFMDTIAYEHSVKQFDTELVHWKEMLKKQGKLAAAKIENVLLFPDGGWMCDQRTDGTDDEQRQHQMEELRKQYVPQLVFTAHSIHKSSNNLVECLKMADLVADERKAIYKTFPTELLIDLLKKLRETSIEILSQTCDPLGYSSH